MKLRIQIICFFCLGLFLSSCGQSTPTQPDDEQPLANPNKTNKPKSPGKPGKPTQAEVAP